MFGLIPRRAARKAGEGGALMVPTLFPFGSALFPEFDRMVDRFFKDWDYPVLEMPAKRYNVELEDKVDEIVVRAEAPGFDPKDLEVEIRDATLILHALKEKKSEIKEKAEKKEEKKETEYLREEFREVIELPSPVMADKVTAKYVNGVLTVVLPKPEEAKGRKVPVTTA